MNQQNINISELASKTGFSITYVSKLLRGDKRWNETTLQKTLDALDLEIEIKPAKKKKKLIKT
jgi:transcriptional regulator with XRE-family HTH domain